MDSEDSYNLHIAGTGEHKWYCVEPTYNEQVLKEVTNRKLKVFKNQYIPRVKDLEKVLYNIANNDTNKSTS
jgi:hypothetical protein